MNNRNDNIWTEEGDVKAGSLYLYTTKGDNGERGKALRKQGKNV